MNAAKYVLRRCILTHIGLNNVQELTINTTGKDIKDGKEGLPPLRNPPLLETADDLATLSHLNEPSGASSIQILLDPLLIEGQCYTRSGIVMPSIASTPTAG